MISGLLNKVQGSNSVTEQNIPSIIIQKLPDTSQKYWAVYWILEARTLPMNPL